MTEYHKVYALLDENDVVQDIILSADNESASKIAATVYVSGKAINVNNYDVHIGDFYKNRTFYRCVTPKNYDFGIEVDSTIPLEEEIDNLNTIINRQEEQIKYLENIITENGLDEFIQ